METYCTCGKSGASIYCNGNCNPQTITTDSTDAAPPADVVDEAAGEYLMDTDHVWDQEIRNAFKSGALWQSRQGVEGKTLEELIASIKPNWSNLEYIQESGIINGSLKSDIIRIAKLYAYQNPQTQEGWVSVKDLPEIGHSVEVITEFYRNGQPVSDRFIGFLNEEGDLVSLPEDDNYGWLFSECVTYWRYLSPPPPHHQQVNKRSLTKQPKNLNKE